MIEIEGRWYRPGGIQHLSLQDLLDFDVWLRQHGRTFSHWWEIPELVEEIGSLRLEDQVTHPEVELLRAVRVWATLRRGGRTLSFDDALGVDSTRIHDWGREDIATVKEAPTPRGFAPGNTQAATQIDIENLDLEVEVHSRILSIFQLFPGLTWRGVWELPLFLWLGVAAQIDELRRK